VAVGVHTGKEIHLDEASHDYDVYVILFKDGKVSAPLVISTGSGGVVGDWEWADEPPEVVYVEGGTFQAGGTFGLLNIQVRTIKVSGFYIGKYEVTQAEWAAVMGSNPSYFQGANLSAFQQGLTSEERGRLPVENVSWYDVVAFCNKLSENEGLDPVYTINGTSVTWNSGTNGYRLPTEAEWEYAARGGKYLEQYKFSGSNMLENVAWHKGNSAGGSRPVGGKAKNSLGLYDMSGNVSEWCWNRFELPSSGSQTNPTGPTSGTNRVHRGGGWGNDQDQDFFFCPIEMLGTSPAQQGSGLGFRIVRPLN
jgi:formylglycine-generating enzyme required for sulfatase activity